MEKIINRKFNTKRLLIGLGLVSTLTVFTGCDNRKENKSKPSVTEVKTEVSTQELENQKTTNGQFDVYEQLAIESYNQYKDFYSQHGAELSDVINIVKIINDDVTGLTSAQIDVYTELIRKIVLSDELLITIQNASYAKENDMQLYDVPSLVPFIEDKNIKNDVEVYETLRNRVQKEVLTNESVSESTKQELIDNLIDMESMYGYSNNQSENRQIDSIGQNLVANETKIQIINLTIAITNLTEISDKNYTVYLSPATEEELDAIYAVTEHGYANVSESNQKVYDEVHSRLAISKYEDERCNYLLPELKKQADIQVSEQTPRQKKISLLEIAKRTMQDYYDSCESVKTNGLHI